MSIASKIRGVAAAALLGATAFSASSPGVAQPAGEPFRLLLTEPNTPLVLNSVMWLAEQMGYYDAEGVNVEIIPVDTGVGPTAFATGDYDMANITLVQSLQLAADNVIGLKAVMSPDRFLPFSIVANNSIQTPADLVGKTFGVLNVGSLDYQLSRLVMTALGVNPDSVTYVPIGPPAARGAALIAGQIDATTMSVGAFLNLTDRANIHVLVPVEDFLLHAHVLNKVNVVPDTVLAERRDDVEAVVRAMTRLARDFALDPNLWVEQMQIARPDVSLETLQFLAQQFQGTWSVNGGLSRTVIEEAVTNAYAGDVAGRRVVPLEEWVDFTIADDVVADLGGPADTADDPMSR